MQRPLHMLNEEIPENLDVNPNSLGEMIMRKAGRIFRGSVHITANNESKVINIFKVEKTVLILDQWAIIEEINNLANCTNVYATLWDGSASVDLTSDGIDLSGVSVGSVFFKDKESNQPYTLLAANGCNMYEPTDKKEGKPFYVQQKTDTDTFMRFHLTTTGIVDFWMFIEFQYKLFDGAHLELVA